MVTLKSLDDPPATSGVTPVTVCPGLPWNKAVYRSNSGLHPVPQQKETTMSKHDEKLEHKSPKTQISGALDDRDLQVVTGGKGTVKAQEPREAVSLEYGGIIFSYSYQRAD